MPRDSDGAVDDFLDALLDDDAERLYERAPCGYVTCLPDGTIVKANATFFALTGRSRDEVVGRLRLLDLLSPGGKIYHETHYAPMLRVRGQAREIAFDLALPDGGRAPVLINSVLERNALGDPLLIRTAVFDAAQRRAYERELLLQKQRAEQSEARAKALATTLQQTLIPPAPPRIPHLKVSGCYRPAGDGSEVGGDFYDVFQTGSQDWVVVIGDVCGKGAEAAVVTALARYALRAAAIEDPSCTHALQLLNELVLHHDSGRFLTVSLMRLRAEGDGWIVRQASGGHPLPVRRASDGTVDLVGQPGPLIGVLTSPTFTEVSLDLRPGDALVLYTDGVTEARTGDTFFGDERLLDVVRAFVPGTGHLSDVLLSDVQAFQGADARDDIAIVSLEVPVSDRMRRSNP